MTRLDERTVNSQTQNQQVLVECQAMEAVVFIARSLGCATWRSCQEYQYRKQHPFLFRMVKELKLDARTYIPYHPNEAHSMSDYDPDQFRQFLNANLQLLVISCEGQTLTLFSYFNEHRDDISHVCVSLRKLAKRIGSLDDDDDRTATYRNKDLAAMFADILNEREKSTAENKFGIHGKGCCQWRICLGRLIDKEKLDPFKWHSLKRDVFFQLCDRIARSWQGRDITLANPLEFMTISCDDKGGDPDFIPMNIMWNRDLVWGDLDSEEVTNPWTVLIGEENIYISLQGGECPVELKQEVTHGARF